MNELVFLGYIIAVCTSSLIALKIGKEALMALMAIQTVLVNLFVTKEITLFGFTATASDALAVGITFTLNLIIEYWGKQAGKLSTGISFFCAIAFILFSAFHLLYTPALFDSSNTHFQALLTAMPRVIIASLVTFLIVQTIETNLYSYLKQKFNNSFFILRNYTSTAISQLIDTILFSFLGLWQLNPSFSSLSTIFQIITVSYLIKIVTIVVAVPYLYLVKKLIKTHESL